MEADNLEDKKLSLSHVDELGRANMVDVSQKTDTERMARARSKVLLGKEILALLEEGEIQMKKGPVFQTARLAGIMGAKKTSELIPLCHPLPIHSIKIDIFVENREEVIIDTRVKTVGKTGVEMEALAGSTIAALTVYDMCKAVSHDIIIQETQLIEKTGGKKDFKREN
ncbi:MAG: cyclic pyranopterin monophosphate synthase MoaC [Bacteroidota bacterium]